MLVFGGCGADGRGKVDEREGERMEFNLVNVFVDFPMFRNWPDKNSHRQQQQQQQQQLLLLPLDPCTLQKLTPGTDFIKNCAPHGIV